MENERILQDTEKLKEDHYLEIYENAKFIEWDRFYLSANSLEEILLKRFPYNIPLMKLVGSSATKTMRRKKGDLDYAVAFQNPMSNEEFLRRVKNTKLDIFEVNKNKKYGYFKISGRHKGMEFVLVPMMHPNGRIETYEQDAFYHPDFINKRKSINHTKNVILMKEFFNQIRICKEVKGISCEMMSLYFQSFDGMLNYFINKGSLRINFSQNNLVYSTDPLIIDYPFLGGRSFTDKVTLEMYGHIQESARRVIEDPKFLRIM